MRLLLVVDVFTPVRTSAAVQMRDLARTLIRQGHDCVVVTPDSRLGERFTLVNEDGIPVLRIHSAPLKRINLLRRAFNELLLSRHMWLGYRESPVARDHWDGIVFYSPTIFFGRFVSQIKAAHRCPAYLILRDVFPDWAADVGVMRKGPHYWLFKAFARYQYAVADVIGIESPSNRRYFAPNDGRVRVLANWIDFGITAPSTPFPEVLRNSHVLVYAGNIGVAQDMDNLLRLARSLLARTDWKLLFVGDGTEKNRLAGEVKNQGLTNVALLPEIDPDALRGLLRHCDIGLISLDRRLKSHNVPGKLLSYLEAGLPVLASINPGNELKAFLEASGVGIAVWNGDDAALLDATSKLLDSAALRAAMATAATEACRRYFSSDRVADQILEGFQHLSPSR